MEPVTIGILAAAAISAAAKIYADQKKKDAAPVAGDSYSELKNMYDNQKASPLGAASGQVAGQVQPPAAPAVQAMPPTPAPPTAQPRAPTGVTPAQIEDPLERLRRAQGYGQ